MKTVPKGSSSREVFIVRLWRDDLDTGRLRGQVQHVRSGETTNIRDLGELLACLNLQLDKTAKRSVDSIGGLR